MCVPRTRQSPRKHPAPSLRPEQPTPELAEKKPSEPLSSCQVGKTMPTFPPLLKRFSFLFKTFAKKKKINSA